MGVLPLPAHSIALAARVSTESAPVNLEKRPAAAGLGCNPHAPGRSISTVCWETTGKTGESCLTLAEFHLDAHQDSRKSRRTCMSNRALRGRQPWSNRAAGGLQSSHRFLVVVRIRQERPQGFDPEPKITFTEENSAQRVADPKSISNQVRQCEMSCSLRFSLEVVRSPEPGFPNQVNGLVS